MYLSKLSLNPRCRDARRDLSAPYELHRTLAHAFTTPEGVDYRSTHGVLFRIEPMAYTRGQPVVLVQSNTQPNWYELPETYLLDSVNPAIKPVDIKSLNPSFEVGQALAFRLVANPTKKEKREGYKQGHRIALPDYTSVDDEPTPARLWLNRKGEQYGFQVDYVTTEAFRLGRSGDRRSNSKNSIPIYGVRYEGLLRVTDPATLVTAVQQGIGPSKAFGFGLLSLARPR